MRKNFLSAKQVVKVLKLLEGIDTKRQKLVNLHKLVAERVDFPITEHNVRKIMIDFDLPWNKKPNGPRISITYWIARLAYSAYHARADVEADNIVRYYIQSVNGTTTTEENDHA